MLNDIPFAVTPSDGRNARVQTSPIAMPNLDRDFAQLDAVPPEVRLSLLAKAAQQVGDKSCQKK